MKNFCRSAHSPATAHRRGTVLIVVLWASLGLVSVALLFGHSMMMAYRGSDNDLAGRQADQAIEGAIRYAESLLTSSTTPGVLPDVTTYDSEEVPVGEATFWFIGRQLDTGSPIDGKTRVYGLIDEASKLNINTVSSTTLQNLPIASMTSDFTDAIVQWHSPAPTSGTPTSSSSAASSTNKQSPFESIEELAYVTGATRDILYGEDANLNGVLDPNEDDANANPPNDNADGKLDPGLLEYVTVFSRESNLQKDGTKRIAINNPNDPNNTFSTYLTTKFPSKNPADIQQIVAAAIDPSSTSLLAFYMNCGASGASGTSILTEAEFGQIAYDLTTVDQQTKFADTGKNYLTGLVNVNTASQTVLAAIVGSDRGLDARQLPGHFSRSRTPVMHGSRRRSDSRRRADSGALEHRLESNHRQMLAGQRGYRRGGALRARLSPDEGRDRPKQRDAARHLPAQPRAARLGAGQGHSRRPRGAEGTR